MIMAVRWWKHPLSDATGMPTPPRPAHTADEGVLGLQSTPALTAATSTVTLDSAAWKDFRFGDRAWQADAWRLYDITGDLRFVANWVGSSLAGARLAVANVGPDGYPADEIVDGPLAELASVPFGAGDAKSEAFRLASVMLFVAGEAFIVAESEGGSGGEDLWWVASSGEIKRLGDVITIPRPDHLGGGTFTYRHGVDILERVWTPHPRVAREPDSPVRSAIPDLREIEALRKREFAELDSRLAGAGLLAIPDEITLPVGPDDPPGATGFALVLQRAMAASLKDRSTAAAMVPIIVTGQADAIEKIRHITFWSELSSRLIGLRRAAVESLSRALDIPPEVLMGLGSSNHWSAWAVSEDAVKTQISPLANRLAAALTSAYLAPAAETLGIDPAKVMYTFDLSALTVRPNRSADATTAWDRNLISDHVARRAGAWSEDDAPDDAERARRLAEQLFASNPQLALSDDGIRQLLGLPAPYPGTGPQPQGDPAQLPPAPTGPDVDGPPDGPPDQQPAAAVAAVSRLAMRRAMTLASQRLVPHRDRDRWPGTPPHQLHVRHGPVSEDRARKVLDGAFAALDDDVLAGLGIRPAALTGLLAQLAVDLLARGIGYDDDLLDGLLRFGPAAQRLGR